MMYLLDYVLPQVAKLSRALQADLTAIVDATLNSPDNVTLPTANLVLDAKDETEEATNIEITTESITTLENVSKLLIKTHS